MAQVVDNSDEVRLARAIASGQGNGTLANNLRKAIAAKNGTTTTPTTPAANKNASGTPQNGTAGSQGILDSMQLDERNKNLQQIAMNTATAKTQDLVNAQKDYNEGIISQAQKNADIATDEYESYRQKVLQRESTLEGDEANHRKLLEENNLKNQEALNSQQAGEQAAMVNQMGRLGVNEAVLQNAQNEVRNNAGYITQKANLQSNYIDKLQSSIKEYQAMYSNLLQDKRALTNDKLQVANELLNRIQSLKGEVVQIEKAGLQEQYKPLEDFQKQRLEDSNNMELSAKQNSEQQYRYTAMDEAMRIAKLKDALYNYDPNVSRAGLTEEMLREAAKNPDLTSAVANLASKLYGASQAGLNGGGLGDSTYGSPSSYSSGGSSSPAKSSGISTNPGQTPQQGSSGQSAIDAAVNALRGLPRAEVEARMANFNLSANDKAQIMNGLGFGGGTSGGDTSTSVSSQPSQTLGQLSQAITQAIMKSYNLKNQNNLATLAKNAVDVQLKNSRLPDTDVNKLIASVTANLEQQKKLMQNENTVLQNASNSFGNNFSIQGVASKILSFFK